MKNLKVYSEVSLNLQLQSPQEELILFSAFDIEQSRLFFASSANNIYSTHLSSLQHERPRTSSHPKTEKPEAKSSRSSFSFSLSLWLESGSSVIIFPLLKSHALPQHPSPLLSSLASFAHLKNAIRVQFRRRRRASAGVLHRRRREIDRQHHEQPTFTASVPPIPPPRAVHGPHWSSDRSPNAKPTSQSHRKKDTRIEIPSMYQMKYDSI